MKKLAATALVALYFAILALPLLNMRFGLIEEAPLLGVTIPALRPTLTAKEVAKERYQKAFVAWFEASYGLRGTAVRLDSSLDYYVFQEAPAESRVRVGSGGQLYIDEDLDYFNRLALPPTQEFAALAQRLARVQALLRARGKSLVPILSPSKTLLLPADVPSAWRRELGEPRPSEVVYRAMVRALDDAGVRYVDARALLQAEQTSRGVEMFTKRGRHWNALGACLVMGSALRLAKTLAPAVAFVDPDCTPQDAPTLTIESPELDLLRLLNVWHPGPLRDAAPSTVTLPEASLENAPSALFVGTSFSVTLVVASERSRLFESFFLYYYNKTAIHHLGGESGHPVDPTTAAWRDETFSGDVVFYEIPEWYFPSTNSEFLVQIETALAP